MLGIKPMQFGPEDLIVEEKVLTFSHPHPDEKYYAMPLVSHKEYLTQLITRLRNH